MTNSSEVDVNCLTFYFNDTVNIGVFFLLFLFLFVVKVFGLKIFLNILRQTISDFGSTHLHLS